MHLDDPQVRTNEVPAGTVDAATAPLDEPTIVRGTASDIARGSDNRLGKGSFGVVFVQIGVIAVLAIGVALRFLTRSPLWLDEALTVNIAREPISRIPGLLRHDGAPPLYYFLLHFWMKLFGTGDVASRSLAGVLGVINLPVGWVTGYRMGARSWSLAEATDEERRASAERGRITAWSVTLLLASSPFAVYYDTEVRMYGLVLLLGTLGVLVITSLLARPRWTAAIALAAVASALLYSHYWGLYLCAVTGAGALWYSWRGPHVRAARYAVLGLVLAALSFVPWLPTLLFQLRHTGTPWAGPADYTAIVFTFTQFAGGDSDAGRALALIFFFLAVLAIFGVALDRRHVILDLHTRPGVRATTLALFATLLVAIIAGKLTGSTFADRYTSVIAFPALLVFAYGLTCLSDPRVRHGVLGVAVAFGLAAAIPNATILRTQAGQVAAAISAAGKPGDVVAYCPDQLGPAVSRLLGTHFDQVAFPRASPPQIVDWVDYAATIRAASPYRFAQLLIKRAGKHAIFYVTAPGYQGFGNDCQDIALDLGRYRAERGMVANMPSDTPFEIYEGMALDRFTKR
ncbi:MAG: glycosyltransferase family 39 protein [Acidimicrobiales bacterium]